MELIRDEYWATLSVLSKITKLILSYFECDKSLSGLKHWNSNFV